MIATMAAISTPSSRRTKAISAHWEWSRPGRTQATPKPAEALLAEQAGILRTVKAEENARCDGLREGRLRELQPLLLRDDENRPSADPPKAFPTHH